MGFWRGVFWFSAAFNLVIGVSLALAPADFYGFGGMPVPDDLLAARTAGLLIATFGIGYAMVARRPDANRDIVRLGVIGKSSLVTMVAMLVASGDLALAGVMPVLGDAVFVVLFLAWLRRH